MERDGQADFDFIIGQWKVRHRRLKQALKGAEDWEEFDGTSIARKVWNGAANTDELEADSQHWGRIQGMTVRLYDLQSHQWRIYWANRKWGTLDQPMIGEFKDGRGEFFNQELFEGRGIYVRFIWSGITETAYRWEQAFSADGGKTWEDNWIMDFTRIP